MLAGLRRGEGVRPVGAGVWHAGDPLLEAFKADDVVAVREADCVSRGSGKEPGSFRSVQRIAVCPIVPSHLCSI
jgi:hypothetical protein